MRIPIVLTVAAAVVGLSMTLLLGQLLLNPPRPLIVSAAFDDARITPNADGENDITTFRYELSRYADVTLRFEDVAGRSFVFRADEPRFAGEYSVLFSGVVAGYLNEGESFAGVIERRLLADGVYTWSLTARNAQEEQTVSGTLTLEGGDSTLPLLTAFSVAPSVFSPNQDGIDDRVEVNVYLEKPATLRVVLIDDAGRELPISARKEGRKEGEAGRHVFDYEGGIDLGANPPPDGTYQVVAIAQDAVGQRVRQSSTLTIVNGGKPRAEIVPQVVGVDVVFAARPYEDRFASSFDQLGDLVDPPTDPADRVFRPITMQLGDMLVFMLTVENYSDVPIRTSAPPSGTVYQQEQNAASLGAFEESGAWRVGIQCETSTMSFPYRWAIGSADDLVAVTDERNGNTYYYLPPRARTVVWGAIRMTRLEKRQNPQTCWAGLIHEDVEVSLRNSFVGAREVELVDPLAVSNISNGGE